MNDMNSHSTHRWIQGLYVAAAVMAVAGVAASVLGAILESERFFVSWLFALFFWWEVAMGAMAFLMIQYLAGGRWGFVTRKIFEAAVATLPLLLLLFVPLAFGLRELYPWARPEVVAASKVLSQKTAYLNMPFWLIRSVLYFVIWLAMAWLLLSAGKRLEREGYQTSLYERLRTVSGPGLVIWGITTTFAGIDWVMGLEPEWYSTMYGFLVWVNQGTVSLAFAVIVLLALHRTKPLHVLTTPQAWNDLGNLILTTVLLWAYINFMQFLVIWYGNKTDEITWYLVRSQGSWSGLIVALVVFHFALPFLALLFRSVKRNRQAFAVVAVLLFAFQIIDAYWLVVPAHGNALMPQWTDLAAFLGVGGLCLIVFVRRLRSQPLVPLYEPHVSELLEHG